MGNKALVTAASRLDRTREVAEGVAERSVARAIHAPGGDSRDWDEIDEFPSETAAEILAVHMAG